jgi:hypothetical protein
MSEVLQKGEVNLVISHVQERVATFMVFSPHNPQPLTSKVPLYSELPSQCRSASLIRN